MVVSQKDSLPEKISVVDEDFVISDKFICLISETDADLIYLLLDKLQLTMPFFRDYKITKNPDRAQFIIVYIKNNEWGQKTLWSIRSQSKHFIKPILLITENTESSNFELADVVLSGPVSPEQFANCFKKLLPLSDKTKALPEIPGAIGEPGTKKVQLLRFLYARVSATLKPKRNHQAKVGYTYPIVAALFNVKPGEEVSHLETLAEAQLLNTILTDRVNTCPQCEHTQINYREVCPHCRSLNVYEEATIHHFRCAYVGKESEFNRGQKLVCPKCSKELRHIGVDYDKPAEVIWCQSCKKNFSEPLLTCFCLACAHSFAPEDAFLKDINIYSLSPEGLRAAEEGALPGYGIINILKKELGFYKNEVFREFLRIEIARCGRYKNPSILSRFNLKAAHDTLAKTAISNSRKFRKDFAAVIKETFRTTDIFTDLPNGDILIIFTNTDAASTKIAFKRLGDRIRQKFNIQLKLEYRFYDLMEKNGVMDDVWEKIK